MWRSRRQFVVASVFLVVLLLVVLFPASSSAWPWSKATPTPTPTKATPTPATPTPATPTPATPTPATPTPATPTPATPTPATPTPATPTPATPTPATPTPATLTPATPTIDTPATPVAAAVPSVASVTADTATATASKQAPVPVKPVPKYSIPPRTVWQKMQVRSLLEQELEDSSTPSTSTSSSSAVKSDGSSSATTPTTSTSSDSSTFLAIAETMKQRSSIIPKELTTWLSSSMESIGGVVEPRIGTKMHPDSPLPEYIASIEPDNTSPAIYLNLDSNYASFKPLSVRELLQNWIDQCAKEARNVAELPANDQTRLPVRTYSYVGTDDITRGYVISATHPRTNRSLAVGSFLIWPSNKKKGTLDLEVSNFNASTGLQMWAMGGGDKQNDQGMAGGFGEGLKVELNRHLSEGVDIEYRVGYESWKFFYDKMRDANGVLLGSSVANLLYLQPHRMREFSPAVVAILRGMKMSAFDPSEFLFLHTNVNAIVAPGQIEILPRPTHQGTVYMMGISVMRVTSIEGLFGLNFIRGGQDTRTYDLGITRDRDSMNVRRALSWYWSGIDNMTSYHQQRAISFTFDIFNTTTSLHSDVQDILLRFKGRSHEPRNDKGKAADWEAIPPRDIKVQRAKLILQELNRRFPVYDDSALLIVKGDTIAKVEIDLDFLLPRVRVEAGSKMFIQAMQDIANVEASSDRTFVWHNFASIASWAVQTKTAKTTDYLSPLRDTVPPTKSLVLIPATAKTGAMTLALQNGPLSKLMHVHAISSELYDELKLVDPSFPNATRALKTLGVKGIIDVYTEMIPAGSTPILCKESEYESTLEYARGLVWNSKSKVGFYIVNIPNPLYEFLDPASSDNLPEKFKVGDKVVSSAKNIYESQCLKLFKSGIVGEVTKVDPSSTSSYPYTVRCLVGGKPGSATDTYALKDLILVSDVPVDVPTFKNLIKRTPVSTLVNILQLNELVSRNINVNYIGAQSRSKVIICTRADCNGYRSRLGSAIEIVTLIEVHAQLYSLIQSDPAFPSFESVRKSFDTDIPWIKKWLESLRAPEDQKKKIVVTGNYSECQDGLSFFRREYACVMQNIWPIDKLPAGLDTLESRIYSKSPDKVLSMIRSALGPKNCNYEEPLYKYLLITHAQDQDDVQRLFIFRDNITVVGVSDRLHAHISKAQNFSDEAWVLDKLANKIVLFPNFESKNPSEQDFVNKVEDYLEDIFSPEVDRHCLEIKELARLPHVVINFTLPDLIDPNVEKNSTFFFLNARFLTVPSILSVSAVEAGRHPSQWNYLDLHEDCRSFAKIKASMVTKSPDALHQIVEKLTPEQALVCVEKHYEVAFFKAFEQSYGQSAAEAVRERRKEEVDSKVYGNQDGSGNLQKIEIDSSTVVQVEDIRQKSDDPYEPICTSLTSCYSCLALSKCQWCSGENKCHAFADTCPRVGSGGGGGKGGGVTATLSKRIIGTNQCPQKNISTTSLFGSIRRFGRWYFAMENTSYERTVIVYNDVESFFAPEFRSIVLRAEYSWLQYREGACEETLYSSSPPLKSPTTCTGTNFKNSLKEMKHIPFLTEGTQVSSASLKNPCFSTSGIGTGFVKEVKKYGDVIVQCGRNISSARTSDPITFSSYDASSLVPVNWRNTEVDVGHVSEISTMLDQWRISEIAPGGARKKMLITMCASNACSFVLSMGDSAFVGFMPDGLIVGYSTCPTVLAECNPSNVHVPTLPTAVLKLLEQQEKNSDESSNNSPSNDNQAVTSDDDGENTSAPETTATQETAKEEKATPTKTPTVSSSVAPAATTTTTASRTRTATPSAASPTKTATTTRSSTTTPSATKPSPTSTPTRTPTRTFTRTPVRDDDDDDDDVLGSFDDDDDDDDDDPVPYDPTASLMDQLESDLNIDGVHSDEHVEFHEVELVEDHHPPHNIEKHKRLPSGFDFFTYDGGSPPAVVSAAHLHSFSELILELWTIMFGSSASSSKGKLPTDSVNIYYDDGGETVAFLYKGQIFLNIDVYLSRRHLVDRGDAEVFWLVTLCHELAHQKHHAHGQRHTSLSEELITLNTRKLIDQKLLAKKE